VLDDAHAQLEAHPAQREVAHDGIEVFDAEEIERLVRAQVRSATRPGNEDTTLSAASLLATSSCERVAPTIRSQGAVSVSISLEPGVLFHERYRVVRCIKRGGMGAVFEVLDERTSTRRALKVMRPDVVDDDDLRERFEREARVTGGVESDHVVRVSDAGVDGPTETPFLVMDYLRGSDLGALMSERERLPPAEVVRYLGQAALGLDRAHAAGIVHRDLKPENLFVTRRDDGSACVKVLDFGIAKIVARRTHAKDTRTMGTPGYMAPEQIRGDGTIGPRADVYALAHIAYTLLVGEEYWSEEARRAGSMFAFFSRVVEGMPEPPSARAARTRAVTLGDAFDRWLKRATAGAPEDRFASAGVAVRELASALGVAPPPGIAHETLASAGTERRVRAADTCALATDVDPTPPTIEPNHARGTAPPSPRRWSIRLPLAALVAFGIVAAIAWDVITPPAVAAEEGYEGRHCSQYAATDGRGAPGKR
jgi:serine/threonine protein kinase